MKHTLRRAGWLVVGVEFVIFFAAVAVGQPPVERKLGTCGPPPRKNPERQTAAESMPPLPLPAVPLRRSEPKAEPAPPLMIAKLEYGTTQDWNTDPGDVDNLMRHCRQQLGLWYGWRHFSVNDLVAQHKAGKGCTIPILYISGHEAFSFTEPQREALRQYVLDGGTFLGDACCGREEFADSFVREIRAIFPDRGLDRLEVDHPVFRAYHNYTKVNYLAYEKGARKEFVGPPELLGINIGCRTAVLFTPWDLSCGWDGHIHHHGKRVLPEDAVKLGLNIISYVAAERQLGEVQAVTREITAPVTRPRSQFVFAQLRHNGDWNPDPNSVFLWLRHLRTDSSIEVNFDPKGVDASEASLANYPFLFMTGHRDPRLSDREVEALRRHLQSGGFLFVNNCCGRSAFDQQARALTTRLFPDSKLEPIPAEHPIYRSFFKVTGVKDRQSGSARALELEGITVKDRLVFVYSRNDTITHLKQVSDPFGNGYDAESCRRLALNIIAYAMQN